MSALWIKDENGAVNRLGSEVTFESFVNSNSIHVSIIYEPDNLITKEF